MNNPYIEYYVNQAGTGIAGFQGIKYQRGYGFFGRILKSAIYPLLSYIGGKAFKTGKNILQDITSGKDIKKAAKERLLEAGDEITGDAWQRAKQYIQTGKGRKRRKKQANKRKIKRTKQSVKSKTSKKKVKKSKDLLL